MQETMKTKNGYHEQVIENNQVTVMGEIVSEFTFSHEIFSEGFYMVDIQVARLSESTDIIPVMVSERLLDVSGDYMGMTVVINGQFRSYNRHEEHKNKLVLSVFAREIEFVDELGENIKTNQIFLDGYVCKEPIYRKTPLGREIADLLLAVNRPYGKSDYIPCICWGRNARYAANFDPKKSVDELAREVIHGDWGNGEERKKRLAAAGYDYSAVQKKVNELLKLV